MVRTAALVWALMSASVANAGQAILSPFTFRGLHVGITQKEARSETAGCTKTPRAALCLLTGDVAGLRLSNAYVTFGDAGLDSIGLTFGATSFFTLSDAFQARYGKPCKSEKSTVGNAVGAKFERITTSWCFSDGRLDLLSIGSRIGTTEARFHKNQTSENLTPPIVNF